MNLDSEEFSRLKLFLDKEAERINSPLFIANDPVRFPRMFEKLQDIEIVSLLSATIAWGNRKMICNNCSKLLNLMEHDPLNYLLDGDFEQIPSEINIHRTFFAGNLKYMLRGLQHIYKKHGSLDAYAAFCRIGNSELPSWTLVENLNKTMMAANGGRTDSRCFPTNLNTSALKRINMALRWLVRNDGIVDLGVWHSIKPSQLFIPLDVHVGDTARSLGLITRKANDKRTVVELTDILRSMRPTDPVFYDYALFGIGIGNYALAEES